MADLRTGDMREDRRGRSWSSVRDLKHCAACLGALPPDVKGACSSCGTGTPKPSPPAVVPAEVTDFIANARQGDVLDLGAVYRRPAPEPDPPKLTWWQRFARWPNT